MMGYPGRLSEMQVILLAVAASRWRSGASQANYFVPACMRERAAVQREATLEVRALIPRRRNKLTRICGSPAEWATSPNYYVAQQKMPPDLWRDPLSRWSTGRCPSCAPTAITLNNRSSLAVGRGFGPSAKLVRFQSMLRREPSAR